MEAAELAWLFCWRFGIEYPKYPKFRPEYIPNRLSEPSQKVGSSLFKVLNR